MMSSERFLRNIVKKSLAEAGLEGADASNSAPQKSAPPAPQPQKSAPKEPPAPEAASQTDEIPRPEDVTADMVAEKINDLRSGKSLKDEAISAEFTKYIEGMNEEERLTLWTYVSGLAEILGGDSSEEATDSDDISSDVSIAPQTGPEPSPPSKDELAPVKVKRNAEKVAPPTRV